MADNVVNGTDVLVFISPSTGATTWTHFGAATSHTLSVKMSTRDTSNKQSGTIVTRKPGRVDVTGTMEGLYIDNDKYNLEDLLKAVVDRTLFLMIFGKETSALSGVPDTTTSGGTHFYSSGQFYITSVDATFPDQANSTFTATFEHASGFDYNSLITS
jgi:hypothetical protein